MNDLRPACSTAGTESLAACWGSNLQFCRVLFAPHTSSRGKSVWTISSEILAFSPALKGRGVPQGWRLILVPFVHSGSGKSACCDLCCACSSHGGVCSVKTRIWQATLKVWWWSFLHILIYSPSWKCEAFKSQGENCWIPHLIKKTELRIKYTYRYCSKSTNKKYQSFDTPGNFEDVYSSVK